ncbi:MAG: sigma-54-dependent Fis family transcriptional regulator [Phycisphaerae bacterium]|nr:sigma-54-dependent Fis family transcriptional regulator [Phycisphaerae bacterium]
MNSQIITREPELHEECALAADSLKRKSGLSQVIGQSKAVQALRNRIGKISFCNVDVLISGESGTGKEIAARAIHYLSRRAGKPFVPVNCGAIPESLFENELFGHVKGAFTDAGLHQIGLVKEAEQGTLFLDEIGVTSPYVQVKLLRLLQNREYRPLGDVRRHKADIRVIAATNRNLQSLFDEGTFRKDLFYRLNVIAIDMPPLRERREDIPILVEHFTERYAREYKKPIKGFTRGAIRRLISYSWPGNIRELEHKVQQAIVMSESAVIDVKAIQLGTSQSESEGSGLEYFNVAKKRVVDSFARAYLAQLLKEYCGDVVGASRRAGTSRTGLWNLLKKHGIDPSQFHQHNISKDLNIEQGQSASHCVTKK